MALARLMMVATAGAALVTGAAELDGWADPLSQQLSGLAAGAAWEALGTAGFVGGGRKAAVGDTFTGGGVSFHLRAGTHMLSYHDWNAYIDSFYSDCK